MYQTIVLMHTRHVRYLSRPEPLMGSSRTSEMSVVDIQGTADYNLRTADLEHLGF